MLLGNGFLPMFAVAGGGGLVGATWALDGSGRAYNVPTLGSELLANTEFTTNTTGWVSEALAVLTRRDYGSSPAIAPTGGVDNFGMEVSNAGTGLSRAAQTFSASVGAWVLVKTRVYSPSGNTSVNSGGIYTSNTTSGGVVRPTTAEDDWQSIIEVSRVTAASPQIKLTRGSTAGDIGHFDAASAKALALATTVATIAGSASNQTAAARIHTLTSGTQAGVASLLDSASNPQNGLFAYHDGTGVTLDKVVNGTWTNIVPRVTVAFSSLAQIEIRRPSGNTFQLWYNGAQRGADQTVADASIVSNTIYGLFSTFSGNLFSEFTLDGAVIPFGF